MKLEYSEYEQGTQEWLDLRKTKITATDAPVIMGVNPWKNIPYLYDEKRSDELPSIPNERMQRRIDLEPIARELFTVKTGIEVTPKVVVKGWAMASVDGISEDEKTVVEIKCPNAKYHELALQGAIPLPYYPQLQHQMYVCNVPYMYYFSFDGMDGALVKVLRDDDFIVKMIVKELSFYESLMQGICPAE